MSKVEYALIQSEPSEGGPRWEAWEVVVDEMRKVGAISAKVAHKLQTGLDLESE